MEQRRPLTKFAKDYLTFGRRDRIAVLSMLALLACIAVFPLLMPAGEPVSLKEENFIQQALDSLEERPKSKYEDDGTAAFQFQRSKQPDFVAGDLFQFDPNTASAEDWRRLGLNDRTTKTILNYRSKGGRFFKPEDLKKIWGMPVGFYERVKSFVNIGATAKTYSGQPYTSFEKRERKIASVELNSADTSALIALPGIGSKLAMRITNFRDRLGGFFSVEQVRETYGLSDSAFQKIKPFLQANGSAVRKFNINSATKDELKLHPYIKWNLANAIVEYRNQHGPFKNLSDLKNIALIDDETFNKIAPYLSL